MQASKEFRATYGGRDYSKKKGEHVDDLPAGLTDALVKQGLVKEARTAKKETCDD